MDTNNTTPNPSEQPIVTPVAPEVKPSQPEEKKSESELQNQYQGVLSNYKEETNPPVMTSTTETTTTTPESSTTTTTTQTPTPDYSNPDIAQKKLQEILNTPTLPPIENAAPVGPAVDTSPKSSIFRTVFLVSLFLFLGVSAAVAYFFIKGPGASQKAPEVTPTITETEVSPTAVPATATCTINDKTYKIGETFASADGCNICSCAADLSIVCTERACSSTPSATTVAPTRAATATPSAVTPTRVATATPTKAVTN